ncbi:MAG: N-acetylmuramoyl-L-alanine amidase [Pseudomonadota bacterium]
MTEEELAERRLALEERKIEVEAEVARARMTLDERQVGRYSTGAVTIIGAVIAVGSAVATTTIGGLFGLQNNASNNAAQQQLAREEVQGQLDIKRTEVEGQIRVQELVAEADRDRLEIEQKFEIIIQATKGLKSDVASENLKFFVEAGILEDPGGKIQALAEEGRAPDLPAVTGQQRATNPLLERLARIEDPQTVTRAGTRTDRFSISDGVVQAVAGPPIQHVETPNHGDVIRPQYIIFHFTGSVGPGVIGWLTADQAKASAHLVIRQDGTLVQLLPLDHRAWHVGNSRWGNLRGLNNHSIGIEFENHGRLQRTGDRWKTWRNQPVPDGDVVIAEDGSGWHAFTDAQIDTATALAQAISQDQPGIIDVLGHSDVSPGRKQDPGPAFPIADIREAIFDRRDPLPPPG